ncbi:MAG: hypothetical protein LBJ00_04570 [Planctomycetaceae bacterium]|jgi:hypothetical protein|nr:hypothetical protein [Planctomycetaceae bacterium]
MTENKRSKTVAEYRNQKKTLSQNQSTQTGFKIHEAEYVIAMMRAIVHG